MGVQIKAGRFYLDADGYVHGPVDAADGIFSAGGTGSWLPDGEPADSDAIRLIGEWLPPVPQHAAEENERLRQTVEHQKQEIGKLHSTISRLHSESAQRSSERQDDLAKLCDRLGHPGPKHTRVAAFEVFNDCLVAIDKLKHDVEMHRDAAADLADDLRRVESRSLLALHAACVEAGVSVPSEDVEDEQAVYGHLVDGIRALRRAEFAHDPTEGGRRTAVHIPSDRLEEFSGACSDLACWMKGYVAGLPRDEFGNVTGEREPMGRYVITEINIALKSALNRADAEKKS